MKLRRILLAAMVAVLGGCVLLNDDRVAGWYRSARPSLPVAWLAAGQGGVKSLCAQEPGMTIHACAIYSSDACLIVAERIESETPKWIVDHERRHSAGWNHDRLTATPTVAFR